MHSFIYHVSATATWSGTSYRFVDSATHETVDNLEIKYKNRIKKVMNMLTFVTLASQGRSF